MWLVIDVVVLAGFAVLIPGSPVYLTNLYSANDRYGGHSRSYWIDALEDPDAHVRDEAAFALGACGAEAGEAVPALAVILLGDSEGKVRIEAALALSKMYPASRAALPALSQALKDREPGVRMYATMTLFRLRTEARPAVPALIQALGKESSQTRVGTFYFTIREMMALALGRASAGSSEAVPTLRAVLMDDAMELRRAAVQALGEIGAEARPAAPQLRKMLEEHNMLVREAAAEALRKIEGTAAGDGG
jgi:HEAT repeat protein